MMVQPLRFLGGVSPLLTSGSGWSESMSDSLFPLPLHFSFSFVLTL